MTSLVLTAFTLVSAVGRGLEATLTALKERRSGLRPCDFLDADLSTCIGRVEGLEDLPVVESLRGFDCRNHRLAQLALRSDNFAQCVWDARRRYGPGRIAVLVGTSTSGILETESAYRRRDSVSGVLPAEFNYPHVHNTFSVADFTRRFLDLQGPALAISTACSSSAKVFASASRLIAAGVCDAAVVGGVDSLCFTTLYGFSSLELVSACPCRPGDVNRSGISIGEAGGFALLERAVTDGKGVHLLGYGESSDAYHMSSPHPEGAGAVLAMRRALSRAGLAAEEIDWINLHGTATQSNDRTEDRAVFEVFGRAVPCSSLKGWTGHTLGAAGIVSVVAAGLALREQFIPGSLNTERLDPELACWITRDNLQRPVRRVLSNAFGFGGSNASLILGVS